MIRSKRVFIPLGLAAAAATIAACTTGQAVTKSGEPPIGAIPTVNSGTDIVLPLDAYLLTGKQQKTVYTAVLIIGQDCMKRFGLAWPVNPPTVGDETPPNDRRYAIIDPAKVKTLGYHLPEATTPQTEQKQPTADAMNVWAGRGEQVFGGQPVPAGGCAGEAFRQLAQGAPKADTSIPEKLQSDSYARTKADSRVVHTFAEWSTCMKAKGYSYPDPYIAAGDQRWQTAKADSTEITVATADVTCKSQTNLPGLMLAVETAYQDRAAVQHATDLTAIKSYYQRELANADKITR